MVWEGSPVPSLEAKLPYTVFCQCCDVAVCEEWGSTHRVPLAEGQQLRFAPASPGGRFLFARCDVGMRSAGANTNTRDESVVQEAVLRRPPATDCGANGCRCHGSNPGTGEDGSRVMACPVGWRCRRSATELLPVTLRQGAMEQYRVMTGAGVPLRALDSPATTALAPLASGRTSRTALG